MRLRMPRITGITDILSRLSYGGGATKAALGLGGLFGLLLGSDLFNKSKATAAFELIKRQHAKEMLGWEQEAEKIAKAIVSLAPELVDSPESMWGLIKNIHENGGLNIISAKALLGLKGKMNELSARDIRNTSGLLSNVGLMSKTSSISDLATLALAGLGAGALAAYTGKAAAGAVKSAAKEAAWNKFKLVNKQYIQGWESQAKAWFKTLYEYAPKIARMPDLALSFLEYVRAQGGMNMQVYDTLINLQKSLKAESGGLPYKAKALLTTLSLATGL